MAALQKERWNLYSYEVQEHDFRREERRLFAMGAEEYV